MKVLISILYHELEGVICFAMEGKSLELKTSRKAVKNAQSLGTPSRDIKTYQLIKMEFTYLCNLAFLVHSFN